MFSQRNRELQAAIYVGDLAGVIKCLDKGPKRERADPNQADNDGRVPLVRAAGNDYKYYTDYTASRICSALLDRGAEVDKRWNWWEPTALYLACRENRVQTAELLIARGANIELVCRENGYAPLHVACFHGHVDVVQLLLHHGADIKRLSRNGHKPLAVASASGHVDVVDLLFDRDVDFYHGQAGRLVGSTAMATACQQGTLDVVRCLIARGVVVTYLSRSLAQNKPAIMALLNAAAPPLKRQLAHWINRIHLHVVGPRGDHQGSARHRLLNCRHLARHLVSFLLVKGFVL